MLFLGQSATPSYFPTSPGSDVRLVLSQLSSQHQKRRREGSGKGDSGVKSPICPKFYCPWAGRGGLAMK